jgi:hypothetical protein
MQFCYRRLRMSTRFYPDLFLCVLRVSVLELLNFGSCRVGERGWLCGYDADLKDTTPTEAVAEDWAKVKLPPRVTGLPMAVWITENDGYPHDVRVKVGPLRGGRGSWRTAPSIAVQPQPHEIVPGSLPAADVALVSRWIDLNRNVIIDFGTV